MKLKLIIIVVLLSSFGISQNKKNPLIFYKSIDGVKITICDSLSFQNRYLNSPFFIDSLSGEPYTGCITRHLNNSKSMPLDSLQVLDGVLNGIQKKYLSNNGFEVKLLSVAYLDVNAKARISTIFDRSKTTFLGFYDNESYLREYVIKFKKNKIRVFLKHTLFTKEGIQKKKKRMNFKSMIDLRAYFNQFYIYDNLKKMGVLDKDFVEPIICNTAK